MIFSELKSFLFVVLWTLLFSVNAFAAPELRPVTKSEAVSIWVMNNGTGSERALHRIAKKFRRETGIAVDIRVLDWNTAFAEISRTLADADSFAIGPDIIQLGSTWIAHFASLGQIQKIDSLVGVVDSSRFFAEGLKSSHIAGESHFYSIPWFLDVRGFYTNERLWKSLNLSLSDVDSYPKFIGTLRVIAKANLRNSNESLVAPFAIPGKEDWTSSQQMAPFIWNYGGDFIEATERGFRSALLDSNTLKGLSLYFQVMGDKEIAPRSLSENAAQNTARFLQSEQLFLYGTSELIRLLEFSSAEGGLSDSPVASDGAFAIAPPSGPKGAYSVLGGSHLAISSRTNATRKKAAESFLVYLLRPDNLNLYSRHVGFLPADKSVIRAWSQDSRYSQFVKDLENGRSLPNIPEWGTIESLLIGLSNNIGKVLASAASQEEILKKVAPMVVDVHRQINEVLNHGEELDEALAIDRVSKALSNRIEEVLPQHLGLKSKNLLDVNLIVALIVGGLIVCIVGLFVYRQRS